MQKDILEQLKNRPVDSNKYDFGHLLIIGGSEGMSGAPILAAQAAMRTGAGLVTVASPSSDISAKAITQMPELMTLKINPGNDVDKCSKFIEDRKVSAIVIGPGMDEGLKDLVKELISKHKLPTVIDGGALTILSKFKKLNFKADLVLTPHLGEFQKFLKDKLPRNRDKLKSIGLEFSKHNDLVLVLKGNPTFVLDPGEPAYTNDTGGPALATAGTGDVLAGIIGSLLAQGFKTFEASRVAVYLHGLAGDIASKNKGDASAVASDVIDFLPEAIYSSKSLGNSSA